MTSVLILPSLQSSIGVARLGSQRTFWTFDLEGVGTLHLSCFVYNANDPIPISTYALFQWLIADKAHDLAFSVRSV